MTPTVPPVMSDTLIVLTLALLLVAPLAIAGVALINAGLGRSRSAAQALLGNLAIVAVTAIVFAIVGAAFAGCLSASSSHSFHLAGKSWNWLGAGPLFLSGMSSSTVQSQLMLLFEFLAVALAAMLPCGSLPVAQAPPSLLPWSFRSPLTGSGMAVGWPSLESTSRLVQAFLMPAEPAPSMSSAE
jgi:hypothetical protein